MRYSRIRRGRNQRRYASVLIVLFIIFGGIYFFTAGTMGKFMSEFITPILKSRQDPNHLEPQGTSNDQGIGDEDTEFVLPSDDDQEDEEDQRPRITESINIGAMNFYGIQMGAFNDKENARSAAEQLKSKGGAGYVLEDQFSRVMAMMFQSEGDAKAVREQLKNQSIESQIYELKCSGVDMEITASSEKIEGIKSTFSLLREKLEVMESIIKDLDNDRITTEQAINKIIAIKDDILAKSEQLGQYSVTQEGSQVLTGLKDLLMGQVDNLVEITQGKMSDKVAVSSKIKYTYIDMIVKYKIYMDQITK